MIRRVVVAVLLAALAAQFASAQSAEKSTSIVLVHGAFVDGSGWKSVYDILAKEGYEVLVVQHASATLEGDVAATNSLIDSAKYPVVLVGHSYGGMIISESGAHPKVKSLVYVAAYAPDSDESVAKLAQIPAQPGESRAPVLPPRDGHRIVDPSKFPAAFAADVPLTTTRFMAAAQVPWGLVAAQKEVANPAWKTKPAAFLIAANDRMIPPSVQRMMAQRLKAHDADTKVIEVPSSHAVMLSHPREVAAFITASITPANSTPGAQP